MKEHSDEEKSDDDTYWLMNSDDSPKKKMNQTSSVDSSVDRSVDAHNSSHEKGPWEDDTCMEPTLRLDDEDAFPVPPPQTRAGYDDHDIEPTLRLDDEDFALPKQNMDIDDSAPTQLLM
jgi:predicted neutral ceramidase superfamily lipid hydrolase